MTISIILPTYNEVGNIIPLIKAITRVVPGTKEIIVVDDNSPDGTSQAVVLYKKQFPKQTVRLLTRKANRGLTNSIRDGIARAHGDVVVWMDCDFSHPPEVIPKLLAKIAGGYDIAVGSRFISGGKTKKAGDDGRDSRFATWASTELSLVLRLAFRYPFTDYTSGFIAVRKQVLTAISLSGNYGEYFIDFIIRAFRKKYRIAEIPYTSPARVRGESKTGGNIFNTVRLGTRYITTIVRLLWMSEN